MPCLINAPITTAAINPKTVPTTSPILMSNESIPAASGSQYSLVEGKIYRGDELVATLQGDGSVDYAPDMARYRAPVVRFLKGLDGAESSTPEAEGQAPSEEPAIMAAVTDREVVPESKEDEAAIDSPEAFEKAFEVITHKLEPEPESEVVEDTRTGAQVWAEEIVPMIEAAKSDWPEGAPPTDYRGDKTPEFAEWYIKHFPEKAVLRYLGRKFHLN